MKQILSRVINALALMAFTLMISTSIILKWILPPGSGRVETLMRGGHGREKTMMTLMGFSRHEWGEVHFYISIVFLTLLVVHLVLHWNWIRSTAWGTKQCPQPISRKLITVGIVTFVVFALSLPWILEKKESSKSEFMERQAQVSPIASF